MKYKHELQDYVFDEHKDDGSVRDVEREHRALKVDTVRIDETMIKFSVPLLKGEDVLGHLSPISANCSNSFINIIIKDK